MSKTLDSGARSRLVSMTKSPLFLGYFFIPARGYAIIMCYYDVGMVLSIPWFHSELVGCDDVTMKYDINSFILSGYFVPLFVNTMGLSKNNRFRRKKIKPARSEIPVRQFPCPQLTILNGAFWSTAFPTIWWEIIFQNCTQTITTRREVYLYQGPG